MSVAKQAALATVVMRLCGVGIDTPATHKEARYPTSNDLRIRVHLLRGGSTRITKQVAEAECWLLRNFLGEGDPSYVGTAGLRVDIETRRLLSDRRCLPDSGLDAWVNHSADPDCLTAALAEFAIGPVRAMNQNEMAEQICFQWLYFLELLFRHG